MAIAAGASAGLVALIIALVLIVVIVVAVFFGMRARDKGIKITVHILIIHLISTITPVIKQEKIMKGKNKHYLLDYN